MSFVVAARDGDRSSSSFAEDYECPPLRFSPNNALLIASPTSYDWSLCKVSVCVYLRLLSFAVSTQCKNNMFGLNAQCVPCNQQCGCVDRLIRNCFPTSDGIVDCAQLDDGRSACNPGGTQLWPLAVPFSDDGAGLDGWCASGHAGRSELRFLWQF